MRAEKGQHLLGGKSQVCLRHLSGSSNFAAQLMQCRRPAQRARSANRVRHPRGNRDSLLGACQGLVGVAQMPEHAPQKKVAIGSTVKSEIKSQGAAPFRLIKGDPFLQMY